ncbi:MAG: GNAT family N-acetyltransferase [Clostridia bacterium]|nr:GNAT family N-acetyltransferase [Clostridia bacterium]
MITEKPVTRKLKEYTEICQLLKTAFPVHEQLPIWVLKLLAVRRSVNFRALYDEGQFCGILYTFENEKYIFVLYLAVNDNIRSKGHGSRILDWLKTHTEKIIVLNVESVDPSAHNDTQRLRRIEFYRSNGIYDTGARFMGTGVNYSVLASDVEHFKSKEYEKLLSDCSLGLYKKKLTE